MTMKPVPIPGVDVHLVYKDEITITFNEAGLFTHDEPTAFTPLLPQGGFLTANKIGPYTADNHDHQLKYWFTPTKDGVRTMHSIYIGKKV
jgi:hypothetical protein